MSTFADWIVARRELDAEPHTRALRAALTPLNEQNHLPVVHATLGEMWAAEAETKATRFVVSRQVREAANAILPVDGPDSRVDDVFELANNWVVQHGWFEFKSDIMFVGLHFHDDNVIDCYCSECDRYALLYYIGRIVFDQTVDDTKFQQSGVIFGSPYASLIPKPDDVDLTLEGHQAFRNFCCIMAFLTCPGATTIRRSFHTEKLQRSRRKRTGFGFCSHNIIEFPRAIASKSTSDTVAHLTGMIRRHLRRGHLTWRGTERERWQPAIWCGNAARGIIWKDYYVREMAGR